MPILPDLTERNEQVIDLPSRYGLVTAPALTAHFQNLVADSARKALDRLANNGWLNRHHLPSGAPYFVLSNSARYRLSLKGNGNGLRQRALLRRMLVLLHFTSQHHLRFLTQAECKEYLPSIAKGRRSDFYFIDSERESIGWVCLDDCKSVSRLQMKLTEVASNKRTIDQLRHLAAEGRFRLLLLTTSEGKVRKVEEELASRPIRAVHIDIAAVPACAELDWTLPEGGKDATS